MVNLTIVTNQPYSQVLTYLITHGLCAKLLLTSTDGPLPNQLSVNMVNSRL